VFPFVASLLFSRYAWARTPRDRVTPVTEWWSAAEACPSHGFEVWPSLGFRPARL